MKKSLILPTLLLTLIPVRAQAAPLEMLYPDAVPVCPCESLIKVSLPNTTIDSAAVDPQDGSCRVTATVTHPPSGDRVKVFIGLPTKNWNGRFRGTGGGAWTGGSENSLLGGVAAGFVTGATDTGHEGGSAAFALDEKGRLNWQAIIDNAYLGIHEMTVVGKALTQAFYGKPPRYCYFLGNSTGGRQGLVEAQRYPEDYDGIVSGCPAINWDRFIPGLLWPYAVMNDAANRPSKEKFEAVTAAAVAACDELDGVKDGIIGEPWRCNYDPADLVGTKVENETFTASDAEVIRRIWEGPRKKDGTPLWYPVTRGAVLGGGPHGAGMGWFLYFLTQNPQWDYKTLTKEEFELRFQQSVEEYGAIFGEANPDLTGFRDHGSKVIILHGMADPTIPMYGTVHFYKKLLERMGGEMEVAKFARLFLAPGVEHNLQGPGPAPTGMYEAIVDWVEKGKAPEMLIAERREPPGKEGKVVGFRPLYPYPYVARHQGHGSTDDLKNFKPIRSPIP
jgi:feruloyl esterase